MTRKILFLHLGAHKTGTTFLQREVMKTELFDFENNPYTRFLSIHHADEEYLSFRESFTHLRNEMIFQAVQDRDVLPKHITKMSCLLREYLAGLSANRILWSDENILGHTPGHFIGKNTKAARLFYPVSSEISQAFSNLTDEFDIYPRLYTRSMDSFLLSSYRDWMAKLRSPDQLDDFLARIERKSYDWDAICSPWRQLFSDQFCTDTYESLRTDKEEFVAQFLAWAGLKPLKWPMAFQEKRPNQGLSDYQIQLAISVLGKLKEEDKTAFRRFLNQISKPQ